MRKTARLEALRRPDARLEGGEGEDGERGSLANTEEKILEYCHEHEQRKSIEKMGNRARCRARCQVSEGAAAADLDWRVIFELSFGILRKHLRPK